MTALPTESSRLGWWNAISAMNPFKRRLLVAFLVWLSVFGVGLSVPSEPFRSILVESCFEFGFPRDSVENQEIRQKEKEKAEKDAQNSNAKQKLHAQVMPLSKLAVWFLPILLAIFVTFTPTNLMLLCVFGSLLGAYAAQLMPGGIHGTVSAADNELASDSQRAPFGKSPRGRPLATTAVLNGLCVFLGISSGLIVIQGDIKWDSDVPDLYLRLAAVSTLFSVAAGSNPDFLRHLVAAFKPFTGGGSPEHTPKSS